MADREQSGDKRGVQDTTKPSSETNTETTRSPGVPEPQKGGPDAPEKDGVITGDRSGNK